MSFSLARTAFLAALAATFIATLVLAPGASAYVYAQDASYPISDYPAATDSVEIPVEDPGVITHVSVTIYVTHTFPQDLDIALESPTHKFVWLMSDSCGGETTMFDAIFNFDDNNPTALGTTLASCAAEQVKPTNNSDGNADTFADAPGALPSTSLSDFNGDSPNGTWKLHIADDSASDVGTLSDPALTITTSDNNTVTQIPGMGTEGPAVPITKVISGVNRKIANTSVTLKDLVHTYPGDLQMVLVSPAGTKAIFLNDACASRDWTGGDKTFDDTATTALPSTGDPVCDGPGPFKSSNGESTVPTSIDGAPPGPYATSLKAFNGESANGSWKLYINDDGEDDVGYLRDFSLGFTPDPPRTATVVTPTFHFKLKKKSLLMTGHVALTGAGIAAADCTGTAASTFQYKKVTRKHHKKRTRLVKVASTTSPLSFTGGACGFDISTRIPASYGGKKLVLTITHAATPELAAFTSTTTEKIKKIRAKKKR